MPVTTPPMEIDLDAVRAARVLGRGAMGTVFLVGDGGGGGEPYALKVFDKRSPAARAAAGADAARRARWEVSVLSRLAHPHLPSLLGCAETPDLLAWALPYCPGGDLNELRHAQPDRVFSPAAIRFYVAEVVSALAELHAAGIAYRDLKPENVLLRADGHVTLTDFDLSRLLPPRSPSASTSTSSSCSATSSPPPQVPSHGRAQYHHLKRIFKRSESAVTASTSGQEEEPRNLAWYLNRSVDGGVDQVKKAKSARVSPMDRGKKLSSLCAAAAGERSFSFVGTEEYVAPEVVRGDGHEFAVDWWALGVLVYEMSHGRTPFRGRNRKETFRNVLLREPEFSADARRRWPELTELISRLLEKDPSRRLGSAGGADEVRAHPFFVGVAWDLLGEVSRPPYIPPPADDIVSCEGFSVVEYFNKLHQPPPSPAEHSPEEEHLPEF
ncbi:Serine/threonine-protein kinase UCNL [Dichanthelium oligosanthes]|uniref:non-specific serine/threonine protein kinase n=1 Tax=Dichanthelium oligosanthes TaxID=888268 RepID=A0A1E5UVH3_9POAL|nr:Serine/threonine-protein kinase UCNL [Dichanthelium oligosanthes]